MHGPSPRTPPWLERQVQSRYRADVFDCSADERAICRTPEKKESTDCNYLRHSPPSARHRPNKYIDRTKQFTAPLDTCGATPLLHEIFGTFSACVRLTRIKRKDRQANKQTNKNVCSSEHADGQTPAPCGPRLSCSPGGGLLSGGGTGRSSRAPWAKPARPGCRGPR